MRKNNAENIDNNLSKNIKKNIDCQEFKTINKKKVEQIINTIGDIKINDLRETEKYEERPKSKIVKLMIKLSGIDQKKLSEAVGCTYPGFINKLSRNSFTFEDMLIIAYVCGFEYKISDGKGNEICIDFEEYFEDYDNTVLERVKPVQETLRQKKYLEYIELLEKADKLRKEYNFE